MAQAPTVPRYELESELSRRGVEVPQPPQPAKKPVSDAELERWLQKSGEYGEEAKAMKQYDAAWEKLRASPAYRAAWEAAMARKRDEAVTDCVVSRAAREGAKLR
jgi:MoxR-like ATPase